MSNQYISNSDIYQVNAERDITVILSKFNTNFIYDCIENALAANNSTQFIMTNPNLVRSLEENFTIMQQNFPDDKNNILACREETYLEIISYLCGKFNLSFNPSDEVDLYSVAYYLYDFLVANYLKYITLFFSNFILKEKNNLYKSLNLDRFKKSSNINYGKKIIKDPIISIIIVQISYILDQLMTFDFSFENIVNVVYSNNDISRFITSLFSDNEYFYNFYKNDINNSYIRPNLITIIRLYIQDTAITDDVQTTFIKEE